MNLENLLSTRYSRAVCRLSIVFAIAGVAVFFALNSSAAAATVNWLDPLQYEKPTSVDVAMPDEASTPNKYYVDLGSGSGSSCTQSSPCSFGSLPGLPGTSGGPAYVYIRGTGTIYLYYPTKNFYGSPGNEIVIKPWPGYTATNIGSGNPGFTGSNIHHIIFDGGPNLGIQFLTTNSNDSIAFRPNANDLTFYRIQGTCSNNQGGEILMTTAAMVNNLTVINSEFYDCNNGTSLQQSAVYLGGDSCSGSSAFSNFVFRNNIVRNMGGEGIEINPRRPSSGVIIDGNAIHNVGFETCKSGWACRPAITVDGGSCASGSTSNVAITNNLLWNLGASCIWWRTGGTSLTAYNNTCYDYAKGSGTISDNEGMATYHGGNGSNVTVRNNIIYSSNGTNPLLASSWGAASNNLCGSGESCGSSSRTWSINSVLSTDQNNPNFMQIGQNSEARNTGYVIPSVTIDYFGNARPIESAYDIGAIEYGETAAPNPPTNLRILSQ